MLTRRMQRFQRVPADNELLKQLLPTSLRFSSRPYTPIYPSHPLPSIASILLQSTLSNPRQHPLHTPTDLFPLDSHSVVPDQRILHPIIEPIPCQTSFLPKKANNS